MARELSKNRQPHKAKTREKVTSRASAPKADTQINARTISFSRAELFCAGIVFLVALLLYGWTLAPTVTLTDSGELIVVALGLGIAHPPGVPLWIILAHLASLMPFGNIAVRINFSSALFAALACAMLTLTVAELTITASYLATSKRRKKVGQQSKTAEESGPARRVFAHGLLTHSLVVRDDHRGLCSEYAAHPRYLLSNASMAATYRRRQDAYRHGDQCWRNHFADYKL